MFNKLLASMLPYFPKKFVWMFSKKYIAGSKLEEAIATAKKLNAEKCHTTIDILGEFITDLSEAEKNKQEYITVIDTAEKNNIKGNYSVKPTMFGLLLDKEVCFQHIEAIVVKAAEYNNFVRIDMEDSPCTDMEIELYRKLKAKYPKNVGLVVQAYMKRTYQDLTDMLDMHTEEAPNNYRLCKGIYVEPKEIAYKNHDEINKHYLKDLALLFEKGVYVGIATHDEELVNGAYQLIEKYKVPNDKFEFQMLLGVTPRLRQTVVDKGYKMRVYVPFGKDWFGYSTRRLKENPQMASLIIKGIFSRK
jgi:proline dehydrogenase